MKHKQSALTTCLMSCLTTCLITVGLASLSGCQGTGNGGSSDDDSPAGSSGERFVVTGTPLGPPECASDADCAGDELCNPNHNICQNPLDAMCAASEECQSLGHCTSVGGACRAVTLNDCRQSRRCRDCRCELSQGECVFSDESGPTRETREETTGEREAGYPLSDEMWGGDEEVAGNGDEIFAPDCAWSEECDPGTFTDEACEMYPDCRDRGLCRANADGSACVFYATDGYCERDPECERSGLCAASIDGSECVFYATDEYCEGSSECRSMGLCKPSDDRSECVFYVTDEICARIDNGLRCEYNGLCVATPDGSRCVATDASCLQSLDCLGDEGLCRASEDGAMCVFYATGRYCEGNLECGESNRCRAEVDGGGCTYTHEGCGARVR